MKIKFRTTKENMKNQLARKLVGISLSAVLATATLGTVLPASAVELTEDAVADELGLNLVHGPVLAQGSLTDEAGSALQEEVIIQAFAWPTTELLEAQKEGESLPLTLVGAGVSDPVDGTFDIKLDEAAAQVLVDSGESVDISLAGESSEGEITHVFTVDPEDLEPQASKSKRSARVTSLDAGEAPVQLELIPGEGAVASDEVEATAHWDEQPYRGKMTCRTTLKKDLGKRLVAVGTGAQNTKNINHTFTFKKGSVSTLGIGVSANGAVGSYKSGGDVTRKSDSVTTWPTATAAGSREYKTYFTYGEYQITCAAPFITRTTYEVRPISYAGGATYTSSTTLPAASKCTQFAKGSTFTKDTSKAVTWSNGANLKAAIGVDLKSQAGYTEAVSIKFEFKATARLCGSNDYPGGTPTRLVGKG